MGIEVFTFVVGVAVVEQHMLLQPNPSGIADPVRAIGKKSIDRRVAACLLGVFVGSVGFCNLSHKRLWQNVVQLTD